MFRTYEHATQAYWDMPYSYVANSHKVIHKEIVAFAPERMLYSLKCSLFLLDFENFVIF